MVIGIDASRAFIAGRTGTENYSYHLISELLRLPESRFHLFVLFIRPNAIVPKELVGYSHVIIKEIGWKYLWTQIGLAASTWHKISIPYSRKSVNPDHGTQKKRVHGFTDSRYLDVLWIPAHTLPIMRNPRIKTVVTIHGLEYQWLPEYKNLLQRWYLPLSTYYATKASDRLIAVSHFTANQLKKELHTSAKKIKVVHEGVVSQSANQSVSESVSQKVWRRYGIKAKKYILFVGSIQPRKNLPALIEAFARLKPDYNEYKLVIAGGVGWMADEVFQAVERYQVPERVIFTGRVSDDDLFALYRAASLYVQPSITEGFGLPVLEAMSQGIPVISSDGGALGEVVGEAGVIVKLDRKGRIFVRDLTRAMERVLGDDKLAREMSSKGSKRVKEFSWAKAAQQTFQVLIG